MLYPELRGTDRITEECGRCAGSGLYDGPTSATFHTATIGTTGPGCFYCQGVGSRSVLVSSVRARARRRVAAQLAAEAKTTASAAKRAAWETAGHPETLALIDTALATLSGGDPLKNALHRAHDGVNRLDATEADAAAARAALYAVTERQNAPSLIPEGRAEVTGTVATIRATDGPYGRVVKMLLKCDGFALHGTMPAGLDAEPGDTVSFTATCTPSPNDPNFGFYKRPTRARTVA